ncbi:hypothetical protein DFJ73DRAFT_762434 [Zopfochytrium polystomum]|nr:hypothetical protein DFJ73DRAFT_762434 [Zopfochytrium polystomum]
MVYKTVYKQFESMEKFGLTEITVKDVVVDLDNKDEEFSAKIWFEEHLGKIEEINTLVTKTISGGYHIYFKYDEWFPKSKDNDSLHIDIKGQGYDVYVDKEIRAATDTELSKLKEIWNADKVSKRESDTISEAGTLVNDGNRIYLASEEENHIKDLLGEKFDLAEDDIEKNVFG